MVSAAVGTDVSWDPGNLEALDLDILRRQHEDSAKAMAKWRSCAKSSVSNGGKAAHAFSKKPVSCLAARAGDSIAPLPVAGQAALKQLLDQWEPLWYVPGRGPHPARWEIPSDEAVLSPFRLEDLLRACRRYSPSAGLGWDGFHPRWVLQFCPKATSSVF